MSFRPAPFRHTLLALTVACAGHVGLAHAEAYQLPAGPLAPTLNQIASQAGVTLSIDPALTEGKRSAPVSGDYEAIDALNQALRGTGLQLQGRGGAYSLAPAAEAAMALPDVTVTASEQAAEHALGPTRGYLANRTATGTKTDTPLLETPRSISVATRAQMQDRKVQNLDDAVRYMPGVIASSYGSDSRADWMKIRGFEPIQMLDGLPLPKGSYTMAKLETWNLERVAVLRGPASSVYGQTPPGGLVDAVSRRPQAGHATKSSATGPLHPGQTLRISRTSVTTRNSSSAVVTPALTLASASSPSVNMPVLCATSRMASSDAFCVIMRRSRSVIFITS